MDEKLNELLEFITKVQEDMVKLKKDALAEKHRLLERLGELKGDRR